MAIWSDLHHDLLVVIAKRLDLIEDFIAFGGVCTSWRCAANNKNFSGPSPIPWLMLAEKGDSDYREFFSLSKGMIQRHTLPEAKGKRCLASQGWLITIEVHGGTHLLHPFSRVTIELPHLSYYSDDKVSLNAEKAVLSASPSQTSNYAVVVIRNNCDSLSFWKSGDKTWTLIQPYGNQSGPVFSDVTYSNGKFYSITYWGRVVEYDITGSRPTETTVFTLPTSFITKPARLYIVESSGRLLVVKREWTILRTFWDSDDRKLTKGYSEFQVIELDLINKEWRELKSIGHRALFLGRSASTSIDTSRFPQVLKPDSIYFTEDRWWPKEGAGTDMGIYNLKDGSIKPHYSPSFFDTFVTPSTVFNDCDSTPTTWVICSFS